MILIKYRDYLYQNNKEGCDVAQLRTRQDEPRGGFQDLEPRGCFILLINNEAIEMRAHCDWLDERGSDLVSIWQDVHSQTRAVGDVDKAIFG